MKLLRYISILCCFSGMVSLAQDSTAYFTLTKEDILANNYQNLEEVFQILPGFYQYKSGTETYTKSNVLSAQDIAIFRNDFPLLLDQNTNYDLKSIPLWDVDRIEVHIAPFTTLVKGSSFMVIKIYTHDYTNKPITGSASITSNSTSDFHMNAQVGASNISHTAHLGLQRSFTSPLYDLDTTRGSSLGASERYDVDIKYRFRILKSVELRAESQNSFLNTQNRGDIIPRTTRVQDLYEKFNRHNLNASLITALSKNHTLTLFGQYHKYTNTLDLWDKDLSNGAREINTSDNDFISTGMNQSYMQLLLEADNDQLDYSIGISLSNTNDELRPRIDAIETAYSDYCVFSSFEYQYKKTFKIGGGVKFLNNDLSRSFLLPHLKLTLAPSNVVQLGLSYNNSVVYPQFQQIFYPAEYNGGIDRNILLGPSDMKTFNLNVTVTKNNLKLQSGLLNVTKSFIPQARNTTNFVNRGKSTGTSTYATLTFKKDWIVVRPSVMIHSMNNIKDSTNISFVYPETALFCRFKLPQSGLRLDLTARTFGKHTETFVENGIILLDEIPSHQLLSASISNVFPRKKLTLYAGVNNLTNSTFIKNNIYSLENSGISLISQENVIVGRGSQYFFKMTYQFQ